MDSELIRKAAEAMHEYRRPSLHDTLPSWDVPFDKLNPSDQRYLLGYAEVGLKVFLEHTRSQPREQRPPQCFDCGAVMTPAVGHWACPSCGKTV